MSRRSDETAVTEEAPPKQSLPNLFSLFPKINFQLPFLPPKPKPKPQEPNPQAQQEGPKPSRVQFPKTQVAVVTSSPLQAEPDADHSPAAKTTNPLILWQIYAIGAIAISSWVWARWNERKGRGGGSPNDERGEGRHSDDGNQ
ncbi:hypothetical protein JHK87_056936 [Glycine soja]|nr:hypothetical protein JHK87_056936 [Glycine soja]